MEANDSDQNVRDSELELDIGVPVAPTELQTAARRSILIGTSSRLRHGTEILKVGARSRPSAVAGAIAGVIRERGRVEVQSIGAGATNQAIKAVAIARSFLQEEGIDLVCVPPFIDIAIDRDERTAIRLLVQERRV